MASGKYTSKRYQQRRELRRTSPAWWQDEQPVPYTGSSADPLFADYDAVETERWAPGYVGDGNYSSGDFRTDEESINDYGYAGFKGDVGMDELGDAQYGGGRYAAGPYEQSNEFGGESFASGHGAFGRLKREFEIRQRRDTGVPPGSSRSSYRPGSRFPGAPGWRDAADWADPMGFRTFRPHERRSSAAGRQGPKNYRRSNERILDEIYLLLLTAPAVDSSDVSVEVHHGVATLAGTVPHRQMKHAIENIAASVRGVEDVENRIHVHRAGTHIPG
jgi:hypothetical protein